MSSPPDHSPLEWGEDGLPRSTLYGDVYYSKQDGLAESRAVFLRGCDLPHAWAGRRRFTVGELGFGTGLNVLALLDLWRRERPPGGQLHIFSIEAHPMSRQEAARALSPWPELAQVAAPLLAAWPGKAKGFHRVDLAGAILDLAVMDAAEALETWQGQADAWFLDGFSPALNPAMWSQTVMDSVGRRSAPGARAATFTVAGSVRRGLSAAGFEVEKKPGFGFKRERLEGRRPGIAAAPHVSGRIVVIGAGIAGASVARAIRALGGEAMVVEAQSPGAGASGNPAALVTPRLDAGLGAPAQLHAQAFARAADLYDTVPNAVIARGALHLESTSRDAGRFAKITVSDLFERGEIERLSSGGVAAALGEPAAPGIKLSRALAVNPAPVLAAWLGEALPGQVAQLARKDGVWTLMDAEGHVIVEAEQVCLAAGPACSALWPALSLQPVRGQLSLVQGIRPPIAASFGGYVVPTPGGMAFGASFGRGQTDLAIRQEEEAANLAQLSARLPRFAAAVAEKPIESRVSLRAATPDRMPLAGALGEGLYVLSGLGSHGFSLAPLLGEAVAAMMLGAPSPLPAQLAAVVDPLRRSVGV